MYAEGEGVAEDSVEAVRWYRMAAERGFPKVQRVFGWMYEKGKGVAKDPAEAIRWCRMAAERG
jgi:TPR repeat protein